MSIKKSKKWIVILSAAVLIATCFIMGLSLSTKTYAESATPDNSFTSEYFDNKVEFVNDQMKLSLSANETSKFKREVNYEDFFINFVVESNVEELTFNFTRAHFISSEDDIEDVVTMTFTENEVKVSLNDSDQFVSVGVSDNFTLEITNGALYVDSTEIGNLVENGRNQFLTFSVKSSTQTTVSFVNIAGQSFVFDDDGNFETVAAGNYKLNSDWYETEKKYVGYNEYKLSATYIGVAYSQGKNSLKIKEATAEDNLGYITKTANSIKFTKVGSVTVPLLDADNNVVENVYVSTVDQDTTAPEYLDKTTNAASYAAFGEAVAKMILDSDGEAVRKDESMSIPSFRALVADDTTPYDFLSGTIYYSFKNVESNKAFTKTTSGMSIPASESATLNFYVVFKDALGNEMDKDEVKENYTFQVEVVLNSKPTVKASSSTITEGFTGIQYVVPSFTVTGADKQEYALYYSADKDATEGWVEIPSTTEDADCPEKYDGNLTFTPQKKGYYKVVCTATLEYESVSAEKMVTIVGAPKVVKPATQLSQNNVLSIVFLCIGSAALVALLCVIFIKPKNKKAVD